MPLSLADGPDRHTAAGNWRASGSCRLGVGLATVGLLVGGLTAAAGLDESLWLDELHTAWVVAGPLEEVVPRAGLGNQLPLYFVWQWLVVQTVGWSEVSLRATSLLAWFGLLMTLAIFLFRQARRTGGWHLLALLAVVAVDRNQQFFATEARPYALLALVTLWSWFLLAAAVSARAKPVPTASAKGGGATGLAAATGPVATGPVASGPVASGPVASGPGALGPGALGPPGASGWEAWSWGHLCGRGSVGEGRGGWGEWLWVGWRLWSRQVGVSGWRVWCWSGWWLCSALAFWLQPTALLAWLAQLLVLLGWGLAAWRTRWCQPTMPDRTRRSPRPFCGFGDLRKLRRCSDKGMFGVYGLIVAVLALGLIVAPAWWLIGGSWEARQAWAAFAGDASLQNLLRQLPIIPVAGPVLIAAGLRKVLPISGTHPLQTSGTHPALEPQTLGTQPDAGAQGGAGTQHARDRRSVGGFWVVWGEWVVWVVAWAVPLALVAFLAATQIAPLVHPRYLFAASAPMVVWAALAIKNWEPAWGWLTALAMIVCLGTQQGSLDRWRAGRWAGPVRGEDWRSVGQTIAEQAIASRQWRPLVFCVSSLIEGNAGGRPRLGTDPIVDPPPPANPGRAAEVARRRAYLALPLLSLYHPDRRHWDEFHPNKFRPGTLRPDELRPEVVRQTPDDADLRAEILPLWNDPQSWPGAIAQARERHGVQRRATWWLAVRCSAGGLERRLKSSGLRPQKCYDFGGVQLLQFHE